MQNFVSPSDPEKLALRDTIQHEVQQFLKEGGTITVLKGPSADRAGSRASLWHEDGDDLLDDD